MGQLATPQKVIKIVSGHDQPTVFFFGSFLKPTFLTMACSHLAGFLLSFFAGSKKQAAKGREEAHFGFVQVAYALPFHGASGPTMRGGRRQGAEDDFSRCLSTVGFEGVEGVKGVEVYFFEHEYILGRYTGLGMYHVLFFSKV